MDDLLQHVLSVLLTTPERWSALAHTVQPDLLSRPPAPGEWAGHDLMHTVQAERALLQPLIAGSGPWRGYFAGHDASPGHTL